MSIFRICLAAGVAAMLASPAFAHVDPLGHGSLAAGFSHPLFGLDHVIAMVAVGLWASMLGNRAMIAMPLAFVGAMVAGFALGLGSISMPLVEPMVLASVIVLGVLVALAVRLDLWLAVGIVALFGTFHGVAHGSEIGGAGALQFGAGFVAATAMLHGAGIGIGLILGRNLAVARVAGAAAALTGVALALS